MSIAIRSRYLRVLVPVILVCLCLAALFWFLGGSGAVYRFRKPVGAEELRLNTLEGSYFTAPADTLAAQTFAFLGYTTTDEYGEEDTVIQERYCYLIVEGKYLMVRVTEDDVAELAKYEDGEEMVANGVIGSLLELHFADLAGTVVAGEARESRESRAVLEQWVVSQNISTDENGVTTDSATGADLSRYAETGDYSEYFDEVVLPMHMTMGYWGDRTHAGAELLAILALIFLLLAVLIIVSIFLGLWERPYREALRRYGQKALRQDFRRGERFGRRSNFVLGDTYVWWLRTFGSRVMPLEEVLWIYPRSRRLEGGKKDWSLGLRSEGEQWGVRLGELSTVQRAIEAIRDKGRPVAMGYDKEKQKLFEKDLQQFKAKVRNGTI